MLNLKVNISIRDNSTGTYYKVPVLPSEIAYGFGDATKDSVTVINLGAVDFQNGNDLDNFAWASFFPSRYDPGYCATSKLLTTLEYKELLEGWKNEGTSLQLICAAAGINKRMVLYSFKPTFQGAEMDLYYSVEFKEKRIIKPVKVDLGAIMSKKQKKTPESRESVPDKSNPGTYTVKGGDTIIRIAKAHKITPWKPLYMKNKSVIGPDPNGITVGMVLKL